MIESTKKHKGTGLKYIETPNINLVPRHLLEQVKGLEFDIDRFYQLAPLIEKNPFNFVGLFVDKKNLVKGFMWSTYNPLCDRLFVNVLSVEKEYQMHGIIKESIGICKKICKQINASGRIVAKTTRPKAFINHGFVESNTTIVELEG